jgi:hypothetical protein
MSGMRGGASKDLGRRAFGTALGWNTRDESPDRSAEFVDLEEEIVRKPVFPLLPRTWKPRAGRIYNFPVLRFVEEK